jgi:hypothetical protein
MGKLTISMAMFNSKLLVITRGYKQRLQGLGDFTQQKVLIVVGIIVTKGCSRKHGQTTQSEIDLRLS